MALRKRLFCDAKPTLLPCKTAAFGTQNNRFCNVLIMWKLHNRHACEKYLHTFLVFSTYIIRYIAAFEVSADSSLCQRKSDFADEETLSTPPQRQSSRLHKKQNSLNSNAVEGAFLAMRNFVLFLISKRTMDILSLLRLPSRELLR
ncbi:hypothetical protein CTM50_04060 [Prevotella intermedia]|uniref:Uncharacterized protein n=1 Tax=Prevotella intermedia TaxID=28131 RepID=A0A2D3NA67_PREIN|nr:hypothetical protein CTM50_04060 [Prevotella intermedia]